MRSILAGLLVLFSASGALAQATGFVSALGFQSYYRPDCWTPLLVHLDSTISTPDEYQVQVHQMDLDKDTVVYTRTIALGPQAHQDFWVYFLPQPVDKGLPDSSSSTPLRDVLKVYLFDAKGKKQVATLPVGCNATSLDPSRNLGGFEGHRGRKLVLAVAEQDKPSWTEYDGATGLSEDVTFVQVNTALLPDSVLGYQGVDAILWLDARAKEISTSPVFTAVQQYILQGGHLVVCQHPERVRMEAFADQEMLPVEGKIGQGDKAEWAIESRSKPDLDALRDLIAAGRGGRPLPPAAWDAVLKARGTFDIARARAKPDAVVERWIDWDPAHRGADRTPYLARRAYGFGSVTWVAQDLGSSALTMAPSPTDKRLNIATNGWPNVWDGVFGWGNQTRTKFEIESSVATDNFHNEYRAENATSVDLGNSLLKGMEHASRGAAYIFLAVLFFVGYWVIAGPGSYFFLAAKKKKSLSWMIFGAAAVVATAITILVVKLVLRGGAEAKHVSVVRLMPAGADPNGTPQSATMIASRLGLYIPRDGPQKVALAPGAPERIGYLAPYAIHPQHLAEIGEAGFLDQARYFVNTDQFAAGKSIDVDVPYRSTLKKLEGEWTGSRPEGIDGAARLAPHINTRDPANSNKNIVKGYIQGTLVNHLRHPLRHVYFAFQWVLQNDEGDETTQDYLLYVPEWAKGAVLDLEAAFSAADVIQLGGTPNGMKNVKGTLNAAQWPHFWYQGLGGSLLGSEKSYDDSERGFLRSLPMMSLIDLIGPERGIAPDFQRTEILRRGARGLNLSQLVRCGKLIILAQADGTSLPLPLTVNDEPVNGDGLTFYQAVLPLDRSQVTRPTTQPATRPGPTTILGTTRAGARD